MILPDVNVLIEAFRTEAKHHERCRGWLNSVLNGPSAYGMSHQVLSSVVRIITNPHVFPNPEEVEEAFSWCATLLNQPGCHVVTPGPRHWSIFQDLCQAVQARGNLVQDAWWAALAIESGCEWITLDRDFARFPGLRWREPE